MRRRASLPLAVAAVAALALLALLFSHRESPLLPTENRPAASIQNYGSESARKSEEDKIILGDMAAAPFQEIYGVLSRRSSGEIAAIARQLENLPKGPATERRIVAFYKAWAPLDAPAALGSAISLRDPRFRHEAIAAVLRGADANVARGLAESINRLPPQALSPNDQQIFLSSAVSKWSEVEPVAAAHFVDAIGTSGLDLTMTFSSIAASWASQDPAAALAWAQQHPDGFGNQALQGAINGWWRKDPGAAEAYVAALPDAGGREMAACLASALFRADPVHAREWISQLPSLQARQAADSAIAQLWATDDPAAATRWAAQLPADEGGFSAGAAAALWAKQDPAAAGDFLNSLGGTMRDGAVVSFSAVTALENPSVGLTWASTIGDPKMRADTEERIVGEWLRQDEAAARAWIQNSSLPQADKTGLLSIAPGL
jgi:hypothetical protein